MDTTTPPSARVISVFHASAKPPLSGPISSVLALRTRLRGRELKNRRTVSCGWKKAPSIAAMSEAAACAEQ